MFVKIKSAMVNGGTQCFSLMKCEFLGEFRGLYSRACVVFFAPLVPPVFEASAGGSLLCIQSFHQRRPGGRGFCPKSRDWNLCDGVILAVPFF